MTPNPTSVPRILAPAGGSAQFWAALHAGADAVYVGLKSFSARSAAENFSIEELCPLVAAAHGYGMRVLVAFNTLLTSPELPEACRLLADVAFLGVDGLIVQDMGLVRLARRHFPWLPLHASTQLAVHDAHGVEWLVGQGFRRVVLARELCLSEVASLRSRFSREEMELEVFCHGSLCHSYSGLCLFGGCTEGRSGNRGECPYPCRREFHSAHGNGLLFSMKDLDTRPILEDLVATGVDVLKIEGRKKDAQYVAATVRAYRRELDRIFGFPTLRPEAPALAREFLAQEDGNELAFSFAREPTTLFFSAPEHPRARTSAPTTTPRSSTHAGLCAGKIERQEGRWAEIVSRIPLERFDGLVVRTAGAQADDEGFSLRDMVIAGRRVAEAPAGLRIRIELPSGIDGRGCEVFKVRSASLRAAVEKLSVPHERLQALWPVEILIRFHEESQGGPKLHVVAQAHGHSIAEVWEPCTLVPGKPLSEAAITDVFSVLGDAGFQASRVEVLDLPGHAGPRLSELKAAKRALSAPLREAFSRLRIQVAQEALQEAQRPMAQPLPEETSPPLRLHCAAGKAHTLLAHAGWASELVLRTFAAEACLQEIEALSGTLNRVRLALPPVVRNHEWAAWRRVLSDFTKGGGHMFEVSSLAALAVLHELGLARLDLAGGPWAYARNPAALHAWHEAGLGELLLSPEAPDTEWLSLSRAHPADLRAPVWHGLPVMISESCARRGLGSCAGNACAPWETVSEKGDSWRVVPLECRSYLVPPRPMNRSALMSLLVKAGLRSFLFDFTFHEKEEALQEQALKALSPLRAPTSPEKAREPR